MPASDELLLKFEQEGAKGVSDSADSVASGIDHISDDEKESLKTSQKAADVDKQRVRGLADLKAGLDLVGKGFGVVKDFVEDSIKETMQYTKAVRDLAQNLGITTEETSRIIQTADDFTVSQEAVTSALQMAVKKGMAPSIDTLAKMADEYNSIADPTERAARLTEVFGRNWTTLTPMLKEGGAAIREAAASQDDALIVTEKQSQATRDLEKNMDNLGDKVTALKLKIGNGLIPILNKAADAFDTLTTGPQTLADAFVGTAEKLQAQVAAGTMTAEQYNSAIQGMAFNVKLWDANTGNALQNQYMLNDAQVQNLITLRSYSEASDGAVRALQRKNELEAQAVLQAQATGAANLELSNDMRALAESQQVGSQAQQEFQAWLAKEKQVADEASKAEIAHRQAIGDSIVTLEAAAQSFSKVTDAQAKQMLAQAQLDTLKKAYESGTITQEQFNASTEKILLNYDMATPKSLALAKAQEAVTNEFLTGKMTIDEYLASTEKLPKIAADGKLSLDELTSVGIKSYDSIKKYQTGVLEETTEAIQQATTKVTGTLGKTSQQLGNYLDVAKLKTKDVDMLIRSMPDMKTVKLIVDVEVKGDKIPSGLPARAYGGPVSAGMPYMVGERGPEMFVPSQDGNIAPNQTNYYSTQYNVTTDRTGLAYMFERQRMAEARM